MHVPASETLRATRRPVSPARSPAQANRALLRTIERWAAGPELTARPACSSRQGGLLLAALCAGLAWLAWRWLA